MKVKFWGVRGSLPSGLTTTEWVKHFEDLMNLFFNQGLSKKSDIQKFISQQSPALIGGFGSSTTCIEVRDQEKSLIIDGGSGIKYLSDELIRSGQIKNVDEFHILMSHFHFDHIIGLPFFAPHFIKGKKIHYYSVQPGIESIVKSLFSRPMFPVTYEHLQADIQFHKIETYKSFEANGFKITSYNLDHPDPCSGFRVEKNNKVYAHAVDHEIDRITRAELGRDADLFEKADLLYIDAQYDENEILTKKGWGHGTCKRGFQVANEFQVKQLLFAHHDPSATLSETLIKRGDAAELFKQSYPKSYLKWDFAYEGQVVELISLIP